jgi:hypothetical protein
MKAQSLFHKRGYILVKIWKDKLVVWMISVIHELRKEREKDWGCNKEDHLYCRIQYGTYMKSVDRTNRYLSYYFILRKKLSGPRSSTRSSELCSL